MQWIWSKSWISTKSGYAVALTCETRYGLCAKCYGRDLGRGSLVCAGEAVGVIAAQSIGEPGTQLTMRTFHVGGAASRSAAQSSVEAKSSGVIRFTATMRYVTNPKHEKIVISRSGEVMITDDNGRERERHKVPYGATLLADDGKAVKAGSATRDLGPAYASDCHRVCRYRQVRECGKKRHGRRADG
jgi:DNA-directed RNA polymerase subunit beta'